ncbi:MBL fold metallo-hydrolase [Flavimarina sp. Hel_I_48]|uniref:MBL fold metallo-hydrolase n=1 Tax=Flavimarina sp. Hel_I_48 TaxID=1392488 RepID=UPI0004DFA54F|nr:MBL fold metallo-hydrolase [Flavimarina sp. Hel_I_48]
MKIKQFEDKALSHFSYAIVSNGKVAIIDPERDPAIYYAFAEENQAKITAVIETHPHADFISAHLQIHKETGATIYTSKNVGAQYAHTAFDDGDHFKLGDISFEAINTPGHSPDSITIVAKNADQTVLFTGDTLFVGDVGRPDLRESNGNKKATRMELARQMYHSIKHKFDKLPDEALIYPAHGAGSLCGKSMGDASSSTLGNERKGNWAFKEQTEEQFVDALLEGQAFIPHYFGHAVDTNKEGAENLSLALSAIPLKVSSDAVPAGALIIDTRDEAAFKKNHLPGSFNIMATGVKMSFETWLGAIVKPGEQFYLVSETVENVYKSLQRVAKIGFERQVKGLLTLPEHALKHFQTLDLSHFEEHTDAYTIVDIRNKKETDESKFFASALTIPLHELRERADEIPAEKPIVVHCAGGYRSAAGSSIVANHLKDTMIYDLSDAVKKFQ